MSFIDLTKQIIKQEDMKEKVVDVVTEQDVQLFQNILDINESISNIYKQTDYFKDFFKVYPDAKIILGSKAEDVFYAHKLGYAFSGVPQRLVYLFTVVFKEQGSRYPNLALWKLTGEVKQFVDKIFVSDIGKFTLKDVLENVYGKSASFLSDVSYKVNNDDATEVYIEHTDRIALFPKTLGDALSDENCRELKYDNTYGIVLGDTPIRRFNNLIGITLDDYDLREVI